MKIRYTVASVHVTEGEVEAVVNGVKMTAKAPMTVVEMVSEDGTMGHTFRWLGEVDAFNEGQLVEATFKPVPAK